MASGTTTILEKTVVLSHGQTRYFECGAGQPVIMLHGSSIEQGGADFLPCLPILGESFRVLAPDFVGWPPSDAFPEMSSFPYLVDFVREFQDALSIRSSHLVGVSMGGWIAALFAYESPNRVDKLVATGNPGLYGAPNRRMANWEPPSDETVRLWVQEVASVPGFNTNRFISEKLEKLHAQDFVESFSSTMKHMARDENRKRYALERRLPHISAPALFLFGETDSNVDQVEKWHELSPGSQVMVIKAGHRMHIEAPALFSETVHTFLNS